MGVTEKKTMAIDISKMRGKLAQAKGKSTQQAKFWKPQTGTQTIRILPTEDGDFSEYQELLPETTKLAQLGYGLAGSSDGKWMFADAVRENIESWAAGSLYLYEWSNEY